MKEPARIDPALLFSAAMLLIFFVAPLGIMIAVSFYHHVPNGFYEPGFELDNYARFLTVFFVERLGFSLLLAGLTAAVCVVIGAPFAYLLTRLKRSRQAPWLVLLLSVLSLSEVIVALSWSILLSRTAGISNLLVWAGLMDQPVAWSPGFGAVMLALSYVLLPYTVLTLYPTMSRLPAECLEAARTMGAKPLRAFFTVVLPLQRGAILSSFIMGFVFTLGSYLIPQVLGRPQHWTLSVVITDQALFQSNVPFAAATAMLLMLASLGLVGLTAFAGRDRVGR
jgi:putative spermidine/putrescine transport system permease protein